MVQRLGAVFAVLGLVVSGCGSSGGRTTTVEGAVSVDGTAIEQGIISFTPMEVGAGAAVTADIRGGQYHALAVPLGRVLIQIHATKDTGKMLTDEAEGGGLYAETIDLVPDKYKTGIEFTVTEGSGSHDIELTSK